VDPYESGVVQMPSDIKTDSLADSVLETESVDLDSFLGTEDRIDWLLIDAEGCEEHVLNGARNLIRKFSPKIIFESYPENIATVRRILLAEEFSITQLYAIYYYATKG
jgi:FkbM family methyltransferase